MSDQLAGRVHISISHGIADVKMIRSDKRNALDGAMFTALAEAGERLKTEPGVRVVVLSGEGSSFCAGLDFSSFTAMAGGGNGGGGNGGGNGDGNPGSMAPGRITHLGRDHSGRRRERCGGAPACPPQRVGHP